MRMSNSNHLYFPFRWHTLSSSLQAASQSALTTAFDSGSQSQIDQLIHRCVGVILVRYGCVGFMYFLTFLVKLEQLRLEIYCNCLVLWSNSQQFHLNLLLFCAIFLKSPQSRPDGRPLPLLQEAAGGQRGEQLYRENGYVEYLLCIVTFTRCFLRAGELII